MLQVHAQSPIMLPHFSAFPPPLPPLTVSTLHDLMYSFPFRPTDTSVFTANTPSSVLAAPPAATPAFLAVALAFSVVFFVMYTAISFRHLMGKAGGVWEKPMVQRLSAWIGICSFLIGMYLAQAMVNLAQLFQG